ncbi:MAG TPA: hypothetical protein VL357_01615 [Rariglobus sp.]|nr:hypothetical protein [Rariglobus sp.]
MKTITTLILALSLALGFTGCATQNNTNGPVSLGGDTWLISKNSKAGIFASADSLRSEVVAEAQAFAAGQGKHVEVISAHYDPAAPGRFPSFEYTFRLVP